MKVYLVTEHFMSGAGGCTHREICSTRDIAEAVKSRLGVHNLRVDIEEFELIDGLAMLNAVKEV